MKYDQVMIRFGDLMLKGKNRQVFIQKTINLIEQNTNDLDVKLEKKHDRVYLLLGDVETDLIKQRLLYVSGISFFSFVKTALKTVDDIVKTAIDLVNETIDGDTTFKIETKRADKRFPYPSPEFTKMVAPKILSGIKSRVTVDVRNPQKTLYIEIREEKAYLYLDSVKGLGGYPTGIQGKALLLLSGGIDSPVAGFLAMKQGVLAEGIHFESTPLTSIESVQKIVDIGKKLALYTPKHVFKIHLVSFAQIHQEIMTRVPESYVITIMRRMMFKIAQKVAINNNALALLTGESIGQVASQTLHSMKTIEDLTDILVLRPLLTYDKQEIIDIAKKIKTFDISIRPFADCCTVYLPKNPSTMPTIHKAMFFESFLKDIENLLEDAVLNIITINVTPSFELDLTKMGLTVKEALGNKNDKI